MTFIRSPRMLADLRPGEHLCGLYETKEEHRAVLTAFMRQGLIQDEKVIYIGSQVPEQSAAGKVPEQSAAGAPMAENILGYLIDKGIQAELCLARGQLDIHTHYDIFMPRGVFDPDGAIARLRAETERALAEGFAALRVASEMSWVQQGLPDSKHMIAYEARLNDFLLDRQCLFLCQYDRRRSSPAVLLDALRTHPVAVIGTTVHDNFYYIPPAELLSRGPSAAELRHWLDNLSSRQRTVEKWRAYRDYAEELSKQRAVEKNAHPYPGQTNLAWVQPAPASALAWNQAPQRPYVRREINRQTQVKTTPRRRNPELALLNRVSQTLNAMQNQDQVLTTTLEVMRRLLDVVACLTWLNAPYTDELVCRYATGPYSETMRGWRLSSGEQADGLVAQGNKSTITPDVRTDAQHIESLERQTGLELRSILSVPLRVKRDIIGVIQVMDTQAARFTPADLTLVKSMALSAATAIENARLHRETKMLQAFNKSLEQSVEKAPVTF